MSDARILLLSGFAGAFVAGGLLEWSNAGEAFSLRTLPVESISPPTPVRTEDDPGLKQCELSRITLEGEVASLDARLAVLELSVELARPTHPKDDPIPWPKPLLASNWASRIEHGLPDWIASWPTAVVHEIDCHEMPCIAAISWEQAETEEVLVEDRLRTFLDSDISAASPYGKLVEKAPNGRLFVLTATAFYPSDLMVQWPVRIDYRAETLLDALRAGWVSQRIDMTRDSEVDQHDGHAH